MFGRIDYQDLEKRRATKACEFIWDSGEETFGSESAVWCSLTGSYEGNYNPPSINHKGRPFDWDIWTLGTPIVDDGRLNNYNLPEMFYLRICNFLVFEEILEIVQYTFWCNLGELIIKVGSARWFRGIPAEPHPRQPHHVDDGF